MVRISGTGTVLYVQYKPPHVLPLETNLCSTKHISHNVMYSFADFLLMNVVGRRTQNSSDLDVT